ncbi:MAG: transglutaminase domain-containing protein, partial [Candidatus Magasanikbacteria bacterium]|nr:transglutaminase domain-containing protein [Candidatus Magasanikbacteria bacterium]
NVEKHDEESRRLENTERRKDETTIGGPRLSHAEEFDQYVEGLRVLEETWAAAPSWLADLIGELEKNRERYIAVLARPGKRPRLATETTDMRFGIRGLREPDAQAEFGDHLRRYALDKAAEIAERYFEIKIEALTPVKNNTENKADQKAIAPVTPLSIAPRNDTSLLNTINGKVGRALRALKTWPGVGARAMAKAAQYGAAMAMAAISPAMFLQRFWSATYNERDSSQEPGAGFEFLDKWAPVLIRHHLAGDDQTVDRSDYYTGLHRYTHHDEARDGFSAEQEEEDRVLHEYITPVSDDIAGATKRHLQDAQGLYEMEMRDVPLNKLLDRRGYLRLPMILHRNNARLMPIAARVQDKKTERHCPIFYDDQKQLYVDCRKWIAERTPRERDGRATVRLDYSQWGSAENSDLLFGWYAQKNARYFDPEDAPAVDGRASETDISLPDELEDQLAAWQQLPTVQQKVQALRAYILDNFGYGRGLRAQARIAAQPGKNNLEKIARAKEGSCHDVNRLSFILLQKLGIPAEFYTGFSTGKDTTHERSRLDIPDPNNLPVGARVGIEADHQIVWKDATATKEVKTAHAHAFLRYFDSETRSWRLLDVTPGQTLKDIAEQRHWREQSSRQKEAWAREIATIDAARGWPAASEAIAIERRMSAATRVLREDWYGDRYSSTSNDVYLRKNPTTGLAEERERGDFDVSHRNVQQVVEHRYSGFSKKQMLGYYHEGREDLALLAPAIEKLAPEIAARVEAALKPLEDAVAGFVERMSMRRTSLRYWKTELSPFLLDEEENGDILTAVRHGLRRRLAQSVLPFPLDGELYIGKKSKQFVFQNTKYATVDDLRQAILAEITDWENYVQKKIVRLADVLTTLKPVARPADLDDLILKKVLDAKKPPEWLAAEKAGELLAKFLSGASQEGGQVVRKDGENKFSVRDDAGKEYYVKFSKLDKKKNRCQNLQLLPSINSLKENNNRDGEACNFC